MALVARNIAGAVRLMVAPLRAGMLWIFAFITISGLTWAGAFTLIDDTLMDWRFRLLERAPTQSVVIVEIDPQSISEYQSWPWSRSVYADVIKELQDAGAGTIALDVDFSSLSDEEGDNTFRDSLAARPGEVILPIFFQHESQTDPQSALRQTVPNSFFLEHAVVASVNLTIDPGGSARRGWYGFATQDGYRASFAATLADIPPTYEGAFHIDFSIDPSRIPRLSIANVAAGAFDPSIVAGRKNLIGATAVELGDEFVAPVHGLLPGVIFHALSYESLVQGRALIRVHYLVALPLVALLFFFLFFPRKDWTWSRVAALHVGVFLCTIALPIVLQAVTPISLDVAPILAAQFICVVFMMEKELERRAREMIRQKLEISHQNTLVALAVQNSTDGIIITDELGWIEVLNDRAASLLAIKQTIRIGLVLG